MGYQGGLPRLLPCHFAHQLSQANKALQQLLEIWNKAKYKERDAMLWGDEVIEPRAASPVVDPLANAAP